MPSNHDEARLPAEPGAANADTADAEALHHALEQLERWLARERAEVARTAAERERLKGEHARLSAERDTHERVTEHALSESRPDAARRALAELLPLKRRLHELDLHLNGVTRRRARLETLAAQHAVALERLRDRCRIHLGTHWLELAVPSLATLETTASAEEIELELLRRSKGRPTQATAPPECSPLSMSEPGCCRATQLSDSVEVGEGSKPSP